MVQDQGVPVPLSTDLLAASFDLGERVVFRNEFWEGVLGSEDDPWYRLQADDRYMAEQYIREAAVGQPAPGQVFFVELPARPQPLPILLHFLPVWLPDQDSPGAVTVTGEVLAEPGTWFVNQTERHRIFNLGRMSMAMMHDLNNLLTPLEGHLEILQETVQAHREYARLLPDLLTVRTVAADCAALVRRSQEYVRQKGSKGDYDLLDLTSIIDDAVAFTRPYWQNEPRLKNIDIQVTKKLEEVPPIKGSAVELREVMVNLIINAIQAMPFGGRLEFTTSYDPHRGVMATLQDSGHGMSESVRKRIFEPMFTTKGEQGTGLGLAMCYSIIKQHDASIDVESELRVGSKFILTFKPFIEERPEVVRPNVKQGIPASRILTVDDDPRVRNILARLLEARGHTVQTAASGNEALEWLSGNAADIVFTDLGMPDMNGRQLASEIRRSHPQTPVVLLSGDTDLGQVSEAIAGVIRKPPKIDELQEAILRFTTN